VPGQDDGAVQEEEDEEGGGRGEDNRHLRVLVAIGGPVQAGHGNCGNLKMISK